MKLDQNRRRFAGVVAVVGLAVAVSACGSTTKTSAGSSSPPASGTTAPAGVTSSAATGSSGVAAAQAATTAALAAPTQIRVTTPLTTPAPSGKSLIFLRCELAQCQQFSDGEQAAAQAAGWSFKSITFQSANPSSLISGLKQALQENPTAVSLSAIPQVVWQSVIPQYEAAKIPLIPLAVGTATLGSTVLTNITTDADFTRAGVINANWFIADSNGTGHALIVNVPTYEILAAFSSGVASTIKQSGTAATSTTLNASLAEVGSGGLVPAIVSALQKDHSIKYVITSNGPFVAGLATSLRAAGLTGIKIAGNAPSIQDEQGLLNGTEDAFTGENYAYAGWQVVDAALRHLEGLSIPTDEGGEPLQLLEKSNVGTPSDQNPAPVGYQDQFKKLWGLS